MLVIKYLSFVGRSYRNCREAVSWIVFFLILIYVISLFCFCSGSKSHAGSKGGDDDSLDCGKPVNFTFYDNLQGVSARHSHPNIPEPQKELVLKTKGADISAWKRKLQKAKREVSCNQGKPLTKLLNSESTEKCIILKFDLFSFFCRAWLCVLYNKGLNMYLSPYLFVLENILWFGEQF